jgi:hypothetical protein
VLPKELENIFEEYTEDDYSLFLIKATAEPEFSFDFQLQVQDINQKGEISQTWTVETVGYRKCQLFFGWADFLKISTDNPLLWEFTDTHGELYFSGKIKNPEKLFVDLYKTHKTLFGKYQSLYLPFSEEALSSGNVPYSNGQIAKGSRKLLEHYASCLKQNGLNYSIVGEWRSTVWDGFKNVPESQDLQVLFLGDTYVIAEKFNFRVHDENSR